MDTGRVTRIAHVGGRGGSYSYSFRKEFYLNSRLLTDKFVQFIRISIPPFPSPLFHPEKRFITFIVFLFLIYFSRETLFLEGLRFTFGREGPTDPRENSTVEFS